ncbi:hypothetical protein GCM10028801_06290 [Nocardioides maradonensis]
MFIRRSRGKGEGHAGLDGTLAKQAAMFLLGAGLAVTTAAGLVPGSLLPAASAVDGVGCVDNGDAGAISGAQVDGGPTYTASGTRADVWVVPVSSVDCQHIQSLFTWSSNGLGGFEAGYLIGYSNCQGYTGHFYSTPHLFYWAYRSDHVLSGCAVLDATVDSGTSPTIRGSDTDRNGYWSAFLNGNNLMPNGIPLDFTQGANGWGMERGATTDNGYSHFNNLSEYHANTGWSTWDEMQRNADSDPGWHYVEVNSYTGGSERDQ